MRAAEILGELAGVKADTREVNTPKTLEKYLEKYGYKFLDGGEFGMVFQNVERPDQIVKIYNDPCYDQFINFTRSNPGNPNLPKFKGPSIRLRKDKTVRMVRMELLQPMNYQQAKVLKTFVEIVKSPKEDAMWDMWDYPVEYQNLMDTLKMLHDAKSNCVFDMHAGNAMSRGSNIEDIVIIDPYADENNKKGWRHDVY
jgi:hypothetical protein